MSHGACSAAVSMVAGTTWQKTAASMCGAARPTKHVCCSQLGPTVTVGAGVSAVWEMGRLWHDRFAATSIGVAAMLWRSRRPAASARHLRQHGLAARTIALSGSPEIALDGPKPLVVFVVGGPGSGKGTQCELIASEMGYSHLSAGELLREERKRDGSPLKAQIEEVIKSGKTVPSQVIAELLERAMRAKGGWAAGAPTARFVVDGYPRSEEQLKGWQSTLSQKVRLLCCLSLEVDREEMRRRLLGRAETSGRLDDNAEIIERRFETFQAETGPLLAHFQAEGQLQIIDGGRAPPEVFQDVRSQLQAKEATEV